MLGDPSAQGRIARLAHVVPMAASVPTMRFTLENPETTSHKPRRAMSRKATHVGRGR